MANLASRIVRRVGRIVSPPDAFLRQVKGVIHVGANDGGERTSYERHGLNVLWVEAIPSVFDELSRNIRAYPSQRAVNALLTDQVGKSYKFNISNNDGASSSILDLKLHKDIWPHVHYVSQIELTSTTLDEIAFDIDRYDSLVIDTQGSELSVLRGAERVLRQIGFIKVEAADFEAYENCATVQSLTDYLNASGFRLARRDQFAARKGGGAYFDLLFVRSGPSNAGPARTDVH